MNSILHLFLKYRHTLQILNEHTSELQVVLIGPKKSGKSTIIECLLGQFFIPREKEMECPLVINVKYSESSVNYFSIPNFSKRKMTDLNEVEKEISLKVLQNKNASYGKSDIPVHVDFHCQHIVDMTFIELPAMEGMDGNYIELEDMNNCYFSMENSITILVLPACKFSKFENSELMKLLKRNKCRTIILFTFLDSFESTLQFQNFFDKLHLEDFLHVAGVSCGFDKYMKGKRKIEDIQKNERKFFRLKNLPSGHLHGTEKLLQVIVQWIKQQLLKTLPKIAKRLDLTINSVKQTLTSKSEETLDADKIILDEITKYVSCFNSLLNGTSLDIDTNSLVGGARISYVFQEHFSKTLDCLNPLAGLNRPNILAAVRNTCGTRPEVLFLSEACFEILAKRQLCQFRDPCYRCVELVYEEMMKLKTDSSSCLQNNMFPQFCGELVKITSELINRRYNLCTELVEELLDMECAFISTMDSDFYKSVEYNISNWIFHQNPLPIPEDKPKDGNEEVSDPRLITFGGTNWFSNFLSSTFAVHSDVEERSQTSAVPNNVELLRISSKENADCELLENLVAAYFSTVRRTLKDSIPKAIMLRMVNFIRDNLYHTLFERIQQEKHYVKDFISSISEKRKEKIQYLQKLCECNQIIEELRGQL